MSDGNTTKEQVMKEIFGKNTGEAILIIKAWKDAVMYADSMGEIRRIDRMARAKLRSLKTASYLEDNAQLTVRVVSTTRGVVSLVTQIH